MNEYTYCYDLGPPYERCAMCMKTGYSPHNSLPLCQ